ISRILKKKKPKSASAKWEWNKMMEDISQEVINTWKKNGVCWRYSKKGHVAYAWKKIKLVISAIRITRERDKDDQPKSSDTGHKRIRLTMISPKDMKKEGNSKGQIFELSEDDM